MKVMRRSFTHGRNVESESNMERDNNLYFKWMTRIFGDRCRPNSRGLVESNTVIHGWRQNVAHVLQSYSASASKCKIRWVIPCENGYLNVDLALRLLALAFVLSFTPLLLGPVWLKYWQSEYSTDENIRLSDANGGWIYLNGMCERSVLQQLANNNCAGRPAFGWTSVLDEQVHVPLLAWDV